MTVSAFITRRLITPLWARWERSPYLRHLKWLREHQFDSFAAIQARQWLAMKNQLRHAFATVPYYRRLWAHLGIHPQAIGSLQDWEKLPILTKQDIREHATELISRRFAGANLHRKSTSGSTGVSLTVWVDEESMQWKRACTIRSDEWSGWRLGERIAKLWGNPEYARRGWRGRLRNAFLERSDYLDTLKMDEPALARFAETVRRHRPSLLFGHAHTLFLFAEYVRAQNLGGIHPNGIIATAMVLHDWQRRRIEEVFACKVTDRYGCEEVSLIACECEAHHGMHINADGVFVEILRDGKPAPPGETGSLVVTDLTNRAMPLIRYQVGDTAAASPQRCSCGRGLPLLERIEGREADYVTTADGHMISGISLTENFALQVPGVAQLQIVQEAVNRFVFRIVQGKDFGPESIKAIGTLVSERFGPQTRFTCDFVEHIPQEPSGKYRFCISRVENRFTRPQEVALS